MIPMILLVSVLRDSVVVKSEGWTRLHFPGGDPSTLLRLVGAPDGCLSALSFPDSSCRVWILRDAPLLGAFGLIADPEGFSLDLYPTAGWLQVPDALVRRLPAYAFLPPEMANVDGQLKTGSGWRGGPDGRVELPCSSPVGARSGRCP